MVAAAVYACQCSPSFAQRKTRRKSTTRTSRSNVGRIEAARTWKAGSCPLLASSIPRSCAKCPVVSSDRFHTAHKSMSSIFSRPFARSQLCDITIRSRSSHLNVASVGLYFRQSEIIRRKENGAAFKNITLLKVIPLNEAVPRILTNIVSHVVEGVPPNGPRPAPSENRC